MMDARALGIIFPNMHDECIPELINHRTMASVPFGGRYRMIDFPLSGMARAGVHNIAVIARENYQSLMDHLGNGREWDLSRKRGGLVMFPPYGREGKLYRGRIEALHSIVDWLEHQKEALVIMSDCNAVVNPDYQALLRSHTESGADVTVVYQKTAIPQEMQNDNVTLRLAKDTGRVTDIRINDYKAGKQNLSLNIYVIGREKLISLVRDAMVRGRTSFERDCLSRNLKQLVIRGEENTGYCARIYSMRSYFAENLRLINQSNIEALFPEGRPVYTKVRDEAPVRYAIGSQTRNSLVADGCIIEGEVENCVLFRGVRVGKGAKLKNCVLMQSTEVAAGVQMEYVVTDKNVTVCENQTLRGAKSFPVFVAKGSTVL